MLNYFSFTFNNLLLIEYKEEINTDFKNISGYFTKMQVNVPVSVTTEQRMKDKKINVARISKTTETMDI